MSLPIPADDSAFSEPTTTDIPDATPRLRASGPGEILQVIPYVLGFHPEQSVVLVALRGRRIVVSARYDLEAPPEMAVPWMVAARDEGATSVLLVLYSEAVHGPPLAHTAYADRLADLAGEHGFTVVDRLAVSNVRWWSYDCSNPRCCPPEGSPIDRTGVIAAGAVAEGLVTLPTRGDLEAELTLMPVRMAEVSMALGSASQDEPADESLAAKRARDWRTVRRFVRESERRQGLIPASEAAAVLRALLDLHVRDATIGYLVDRPKPEVAAAWRELVRIAPPPWRAPVATIYAFWCYAAGEGARTNVAIEVALTANPDYSMAHLLDEMVGAGINPLRFIPDLASECRPIARRIERKLPPAGRRRPKRRGADG